jgi:lipopolysaccharide/colanic/teichoic acid biosynthesis glycosyltransferase
VGYEPFDMGNSGIKIWCSLPLMFLVGLLVKLDSPGPIFIRLKRMGQGGRPFTQLRFRTTVDGSYNVDRLTLFGYVLEKTGFSGLPHILSVLKGDMNVIGPIAFQLYFTEKHELENMPGFTTRHAVKPGLFSFAQRCALKEDTLRRTIRYDAFYIKNRNFWLDLRLTMRALWDARTRRLNRQWRQRVLPPAPAEIRTECTRVENLIAILNGRYNWFVKGMFITSIIAYLSCLVYAVVTFGFLRGVGLGLWLAPVTARLVAWLWPLIALTVPVVVMLVLST